MNFEFATSPGYVTYLADNFDVQCFEINVVNSVSQFVCLKVYTVI